MPSYRICFGTSSTRWSKGAREKGSGKRGLMFSVRSIGSSFSNEELIPWEQTVMTHLLAEKCRFYILGQSGVVTAANPAQMHGSRRLSSSLSSSPRSREKTKSKVTFFV